MTKNGNEKNIDQVRSYINEATYEATIWYNDKVLDLEDTNIHDLFRELELKSAGGVSFSVKQSGMIGIWVNPVTIKGLTLEAIVDKVSQFVLGRMQD